mmetsp:Transcript_106701/g.339782  ORF Transcript_106701/g.339782 Transcript_106701/m.339782 type:complete len:202 (-) Transcript_106701:1056-1661(-)
MWSFLRSFPMQCASSRRSPCGRPARPPALSGSTPPSAGPSSSRCGPLREAGRAQLPADPLVPLRLPRLQGALPPAPAERRAGQGVARQRLQLGETEIPGLPHCRKVVGHITVVPHAGVIRRKGQRHAGAHEAEGGVCGQVWEVTQHLVADGAALEGDPGGPDPFEQCRMPRQRKAVPDPLAADDHRVDNLRGVGDVRLAGV